MLARWSSASTTMASAQASSKRLSLTSAATSCPHRTSRGWGRARSTSAMATKASPAMPSGPSVRPAPEGSRAQAAHASTPAPQSLGIARTPTDTPAFRARSPSATGVNRPRPPETHAPEPVQKARTARAQTLPVRPIVTGSASSASHSGHRARSMASASTRDASKEPVLRASPKARPVHRVAASDSAATRL